jgi:hypothetical protein
MQTLGLTHAEARSYQAALASSHSVRIRVAFCDLDQRPIASLPVKVLPGSQVDIDTTGGPTSVTRMLSMQFLDPRNVLDLDPRSRDAGSIYLDRIIKVYHSIWVDDLGRWVTARPFTGVPFGRITRDGAVVSVQAHGKERLALRPTWKPFHRNPGYSKIRAIRDLLAYRAGEAFFDFPSKNRPHLPHGWSVGREQIMWPVAKHAASSLDRQLFYPGNGVCTLRTLPGKPVRIFRRGNGGTLVQELTIDSEVDDFANTALVTGRKGIEPGLATLRQHHPLSAQSLARGGVDGTMAVFAHNDHIRNAPELDRRAVRLLDRQNVQEVSYSYAALMDPRLDELDMVAAERADGSLYEHRLTKASLPLDGGAMTIGYHRRSTLARHEIRKR